MIKARKRVLIVQSLHPSALALLDAREDVEYELLKDLREINLLNAVKNVDAIAIRDAPLSPTVVEKATSTMVISRHGVGYDNIPVHLCTKLNIPVTVVGPVNAVSVAEHTMFLLLAAAKGGISLDSAVREGRFSARSNTHGLELRGKRLLLIGFGRIGREVALRAACFGLRILVYDPYLEGSKDLSITLFDSLGEALEQADIVSLHLPLTDETRGILSEQELALLPKGAIVINTSRGGLVDEQALLDAITSNALHGAGIDTFNIEPLPKDSALIAEKRIVLSPHSAALTENALIAMGMKTIENVLAAIDGVLDPQYVINKEVLGSLQSD